MVFMPNVMNYKCIDHRDTNKHNNNVLNLVWCTHEQNSNNELSKNKMSESRRGKHHKEETKKKISESHKGKHHTEEHKNKMSESHKGKHISEETKKKMSEKHNKKVLCLETGEIFASVGEASRNFGISVGGISDVCRGKCRQTHNLTFRKLEQVLFYN